MKFIGIGGCSRSGKTSLTHRIKDLAIAKELRFKCIHQDELILPEDKLERIRDRVDWEKESSLDIEKQSSVIQDAFSRKDIIVIEGIFIHPSFEPMLDNFIYLNIRKTDYIDRRKNETRWGDEEDWYINYVWDRHQDFYSEKISPYFNKPESSTQTAAFSVGEITEDYLVQLISR